MATLEIWTFTTGVAPTVDLTGFKVEARDDDIGKVDEATYEAGGSFLVVDTGPWIFGKKVMLPAGVISQLDSDNQTVSVNRTKEEIKNSPNSMKPLIRNRPIGIGSARTTGRRARVIATGNS